MISVKEARNAMKGMTNLRKELEKERSRLNKSVKTLRKQAKAGTLPEWSEDVMKLYRSPDYSFVKLMKLMRKHKVL
ncbi:MAG: hypothetical protein K0R57_1572 [Paenibacillaceae bacterium]|nr:hypothetical protein [Paenibacillaceae bacterium]